MIKAGVVFGGIGSYSGLFDIQYDVSNIADIQAGTDLILFTGGPDVKDSMSRTIKETAIADYCFFNDIPMVGICRGHQFLGWYSDIPLIEHIDGHYMCNHSVTDVLNGNQFNVKGDHHQAVEKSDLLEILLESDDGIVEAALFPEVKGFGVQYHPEWMSSDSEGYVWFQEKVKELIK